jgi:hypothetical protein
MSCCRKEYKQISYAVRHQLRDGWQVEGFDINLEDTDLLCDHCNEPIESAYGESVDDSPEGIYGDALRNNPDA